MKWLHVGAFVLTIVGAINWGLIGLVDYNLVASLLSKAPEIERVVYILVGLSAVYLASTHMNDCKTCKMK